MLSRWIISVSYGMSQGVAASLKKIRCFSNYASARIELDRISDIFSGLERLHAVTGLFVDGLKFGNVVLDRLV